MSLLGNILWLVFGGFLSALGFFVGGALLCITIIGIPFGMQSFRLAGTVLSPFGKQRVATRSEQGPIHVLFNILWLVLFGWEIALTHLVSGALLALTIVGIPFALQHLKIVPIALFPFGQELRKEQVFEDAPEQVSPT